MPVESPRPGRRRPVVVTWLAGGVLTFSAFYLARLALSLSLPALPLSVPDWYLPLTGGLWGGVGLALAAALWRGVRGADRAAGSAGAVYLLWYWFDRLVFVQTDFAQRSLPTAAVLSVLGAALLYGALTQPSVRDFFLETPDE